MGAVIILVLAGVALLIWIFTNLDRHHDKVASDTRPSTYCPPENPEPESGSKLINHVGTPPAPEPGSSCAGAAGDGQTLDELYAASHNLWVCDYCETMNLNSSRRCIACGHGKNE